MGISEVVMSAMMEHMVVLADGSRILEFADGLNYGTAGGESQGS